MRRLAVMLVVPALIALVPINTAQGTTDEPLQYLQWGLEKLEVEQAWAAGYTGEGVVVAVVDDGVGRDHEEFGPERFHPASASWWGCPPGDPVPCTDPAAWSRKGHGHRVAGIIAAARNGVGMAGIAPEVEIMALRAVGGGLEQLPEAYEAVAEAVRYAVDHGADVINFSLGASPHVWVPAAAIPIAHLYDWGEAIAYALDHDVMVAVAAGNGFQPICENTFLVEGADPLCVGATDRDDFHRFDSDWGLGVDLVAPGGGLGGVCAQILTVGSIGNQSDCKEVPPGYLMFGQTSAATPHVTAVGALLAQQGIRGRDAAERIIDTVDDLGPPGWDPLYGYGRVNAARAVGV